MATEEEIKNTQPIAQPAVQPVAQPVSTTAPVASTPPTPLAPLSAGAVYSPTNVQQVLTGTPASLQNTKLSKLEKSLAAANQQAEINQANIGNQTLAMGVISGQQAYQSRLDTARINAVAGVYNAKLQERQRKLEKEALAKQEEQQRLDNQFRERQLKSTTAQKGSTSSVSNLNSLLERAAQMPSGGREWAASVAGTFGINPADVVAATQQNGWEQAYRIPTTEKPPTAAQSLASGFATRLESSGNILKNFANTGSSLIGTISGRDGFPNILKSKERQQMEQAQRDFINAQLRRESGAAISPTEFANAAQQYFPQPGDSREVILQKELARNIAIENMKKAAATAYQPGEQDINDILSQFGI